MVLASEPVGGRSRATELPCLYLECKTNSININALTNNVVAVFQNASDTCTEHNLVLVLSELIGKSRRSTLHRHTTSSLGGMAL